MKMSWLYYRRSVYVCTLVQLTCSIGPASLMEPTVPVFVVSEEAEASTVVERRDLLRRRWGGIEFWGEGVVVLCRACGDLRS
jgi:hypothetical protein